MKLSKLSYLMLSAIALSGCSLNSFIQDGTGVENESSTPNAPVGYKWQTVKGMSDEFSGDRLDTSKWQDHIKTWQGRPPAEFLPANISVADGSLQIKTSTHPSPNETYTMGGAAVKGIQEKRYGYYETRLKASKVRMSTTFWLHSDGHEDVDMGCEKQHGIEIDILEAIGGWYNDTWTNVMRSNTHYKSTEVDENGKCVRAKYLSKGAKKDTGYNLSDGFHTFAAWWVNPNLVHFYFDGVTRPR